MYINKNKLHFTQKEMEASTQVWNRTAISLLDIRHNLISSKKVLRGYQIPSSSFVFTNGGKAEIVLNDTAFSVERFGLFHASKGTKLTIQPQCEWLEYYMVLYKAGEPPFQKMEYRKLIENINPFRLQYGFSPSNPIFLLELLQKMYEKWKGPTPINLFYTKSAFYQLAFAIYEELEQGMIEVFEPDSIAMAKRYLDEHYGEEIAIQDLCRIFGISYSHFHRSFKSQIGRSPQEYLINTRLDAARELMKTSNATLREIAIRCGFADEHGLYRMFVKKNGISPSVYREELYTSMRDNALQNITPFPYNEQGQVSLDELGEKGEIHMFKQMKNKGVVAVALSLMLLLSACGTASTTTNSGDSKTTSTVTGQEKETKQVEEGMRTIQTVKGDVEVPVTPKRVVVDYLIGDVVALGVIPLGVAKSENGDSKTAFADEITQSIEIESWEMNVEEIMALEPDLIILAFSEEPYEDLSKIAPTVYVPYGNMTTKERIEFIGDVLNKQEEADTVMSDYNEKITIAKQTLQDAGLADAKVTIGQFGADGSYIAGAKHAVGVVAYNELGLKVPEKVQTEIIDKNEYWGNVSFETLEPFCGDYLISLGEIEPSVTDNAVWQLVPAVQNERIINTDTAITWYTDIMSSQALIDIIVDGLVDLSKK